MNVALIHNFYRQPGGEDRVFAQEGALLESKGQCVTRFEAHNLDIPDGAGLKVAARTVWNQSSYSRVRALLRSRQIDVVHVHNTFPMLSPAVYYAAKAEGVAVVQTLHNYRLLCPAATLFRDGRPCEECVGRAVPWPGVQHACYRDQRLATAAVASMLVVHRALGTWSRAVDRYIALTAFARDKFIQGGLPASKLVVKPNFVHPDPGTGEGAGDYALFVGRLSAEKGVATLTQAWSLLAGRVPLRIVGDGPMAEMVREASMRLPGVRWLGRLTPERTLEELKQAAFLIVPSTWYEPFGLSVLEAFATGTPVLASNIGSLTELIADNRTGMHFNAGDAHDLAAKVIELFENRALLQSMRKAARAEFEEKYSGDLNYKMLMRIYQDSMGSRRSEPSRTLAEIR
jgi:glycosyltransferase involved in cell wall biosynthesis